MRPKSWVWWLAFALAPLAVQADEPRAAPPGAPASQPEGAAPSGRFVVAGDGLVADRRTGLVWQRCSVGQRFDAAWGCVGLARKLWFAEARKLETAQWRLPTGTELRGLYDERLQALADTDAFPDAPATWFWATGPGRQPMALGVSCGSGGNDSCYQADSRAVRLVRRERMRWPPK